MRSDVEVSCGEGVEGLTGEGGRCRARCQNYFAQEPIFKTTSSEQE